MTRDGHDAGGNEDATDGTADDATASGASAESETGAWLAARRGLAEPVYEPAEDSGLVAAAAADHASGRVLEVGTGSGWVAARVAESESIEQVIGSDVNPHACRAARDRGVAAVRADLVAPFGTDSFDTVVFNPPYLPTDPASALDDWQERALSGGESGRALIEPFLADLGRVLRPDGVGVLLVSSLAGFGAVVEHAVECGFDCETVREESYPFETLSVLRLTHRE